MLQWVGRLLHSIRWTKMRYISFVTSLYSSDRLLKISLWSHRDICSHQMTLQLSHIETNICPSFGESTLKLPWHLHYEVPANDVTRKTNKCWLLADRYLDNLLWSPHERFCDKFCLYLPVNNTAYNVAQMAMFKELICGARYKRDKLNMMQVICIVSNCFSFFLVSNKFNPEETKWLLQERARPTIVVYWSQPTSEVTSYMASDIIVKCFWFAFHRSCDDSACYIGDISSAWHVRDSRPFSRTVMSSFLIRQHT